MGLWGGLGEGAGGYLRSLGDDVSNRVRREIRSTQDDILGKVRSAGRGGAMLGGAAVLGAVSAGTAGVLVLRTLEAVLPRRAAAFVATVLFGAGAAALGAAGVEELRRSLPGGGSSSPGAGGDLRPR